VTLEHNILIASVGGQGGITLSRILSTASMIQGLKVRVGETLGMAQRGGSVTSHVRIGEAVHGPMIPEGGADVLLCLEPAEALRVIKYMNKDSKVIVNTTPVIPVTVMINQTEYPPMDKILELLHETGAEIHTIDANRLAEDACSARSMNIVMIGAYLALNYGVLSNESITEALGSVLSPRYLDGNRKALKLGMEAIR
jgi:indolepyruvate ferredoxin oxidoreductase beta subunit